MFPQCSVNFRNLWPQQGHPSPGFTPDHQTSPKFGKHGLRPVFELYKNMLTDTYCPSIGNPLWESHLPPSSPPKIGLLSENRSAKNAVGGWKLILWPSGNISKPLKHRPFGFTNRSPGGACRPGLCHGPVHRIINQNSDGNF